MKKEILIGIIVFLSTSIITIALEYIPKILNKPNGLFSINTINIEDLKYYQIKLENISDKNQTLCFFVKDSNIVIKSTDYVDYKIEKTKLDTTICLLTINQLPNNFLNLTITGILDISFNNNVDKKYVCSEVLAKSNLNIIKYIIIKTIIYLVLIFISYYVTIKHFNKKIEKINTKFGEFEIENRKKCEEFENKIKNIKNAHVKYDLLMSAKIRDYVKELDFWKDVFSKILIEEQTIKPKDFFKNITEKLKTYGTRKITDEQINMAEYIEKTTRI